MNCDNYMDNLNQFLSNIGNFHVAVSTDNQALTSIFNKISANCIQQFIQKTNENADSIQNINLNIFCALKYVSETNYLIFRRSRNSLK